MDHYNQVIFLWQIPIVLSPVCKTPHTTPGDPVIHLKPGLWSAQLIRARRSRVPVQLCTLRSTIREPEYTDVSCCMAEVAAVKLCTLSSTVREPEYTDLHCCMTEVADRTVHTLSGGQKQRVAIAGALVQNPQVTLSFLISTLSLLLLLLLSVLSSSSLLLLFMQNMHVLLVVCVLLLNVCVLLLNLNPFLGFEHGHETRFLGKAPPSAMINMVVPISETISRKVIMRHHHYQTLSDIIRH